VDVSLSTGKRRTIRQEIEKTEEEGRTAACGFGEIGETCERKHFDGDFRWFLFCGSPVRVRSGTVAKWYGTNTDLEERKGADQALRKSEERWRSVFENSAIGVALTDHNGRFLA